MATMQDVVNAALELLPPVGKEMEFEEYKAKLYAAHPDGGKDAFAHIIKRSVLNSKLRRNDKGKLVVMLSRKA